MKQNCQILIAGECVCERVIELNLDERLDGSLKKTCHTIRGVSTLCTFLSLLILQISGGWGHGAGPPRPRRPERRKGWIYSSLHRNSRANVLMAQVLQALRLRTSRGSLSNYRSSQDSLTDTHTHTHTHTFPQVQPGGEFSLGVCSGGFLLNKKNCIWR